MPRASTRPNCWPLPSTWRSGRGSPAPRCTAKLAATIAGLEAWLAGEAHPPDWPGLAPIEPARAYPARHGAMLLPWKAALAALSSTAPAG